MVEGAKHTRLTAHRLAKGQSTLPLPGASRDATEVEEPGPGAGAGPAPCDGLGRPRRVTHAADPAAFDELGDSQALDHLQTLVAVSALSDQERSPDS
jgi:hypothetical protein